MSYDISLVNLETREPVKVKNHSEGGIYAMGGTTEASLNVTYNYYKFYQWFLDKKLGIRWLYNKKGKDCIERLEKAVEILGTKQYKPSYWAPVPGNAGFALNILLGWAKEHPNAVFMGD